MYLMFKIQPYSNMFMVLLYCYIYSRDNNIIKGFFAYFWEQFRHTLYLMSPIFFLRLLLGVFEMAFFSSVLKYRLDHWAFIC